MNRLTSHLATGFILGYAPLAPGTAGSLFSLLVFVLLPPLSLFTFISIILIAFFIGVVVSGRVEKDSGKDPSIVVIDEIVGMWIALVALPRNWVYMLASFFLFRILDIIKPFPARRSQNLPGGWGIMIDDLIAAIYANALLQIVKWIF
ncbi:MAG: phosphatidylglycerophosphatase A [Fidelibacterota bacterium]